ncbi:uncharacterized protein G2W53_027406 [Senna tora]|uniref:Uncharacterized protein n=1 Tax=Senna tora TaxID=362788 RepID=A0A834TJE9_9FABA|nr:uncharacterized protein G2W53_027406 [Senna tora]
MCCRLITIAAGVVCRSEPPSIAFLFCIRHLGFLALVKIDYVSSLRFCSAHCHLEAFWQGEREHQRRRRFMKLLSSLSTLSALETNLR